MASEVTIAEKTEEQRRGREGARWINMRPSPEEFGAWAKDNIPIDNELSIEDYIGGIVLIPAVESKAKYIHGFNVDGEPTIGERAELAYIPYAKVETRVQYFWDLLAKHDDWIGVVEPIVTARPELGSLSEIVRDLPVEGDELAADLKERQIFKPAATAAIVHQLPPGFFLMPVPTGMSYTYSLCCSYRVAIYEKGANADARPIREGRGTKQVALVVGKWGQNRGERITVPDENALMKAETGAIGRALGAAGIFNIPGSGIATAEDMIEAANGNTAAASPEPSADSGAGPAAPTQAPAPAAVAAQPEETDEDVLEASKTIVARLQEDFPDAYDAFGKWGAQRRPKITDLGELNGPALRGTHRKLSKLLEEAEKRQTERGQGEAEVEVPKEQDAVAAAAVAQEEPGGEPPALV